MTILIQRLSRDDEFEMGNYNNYDDDDDYDDDVVKLL